MILKPKFLAALISVSFIILASTVTEAHLPHTPLGIIFWVSFATFAFCCIHLSKNASYYEKQIDEIL